VICLGINYFSAAEALHIRKWSTQTVVTGRTMQQLLQTCLRSVVIGPYTGYSEKHATVTMYCIFVIFWG